MYRSPVKRINRLPANREDKSSYRQRLRESACGAFRVVSGESQSQLLSALILARHDVKEYFNWQTNKYTELLIPSRHGVTYMQRNSMLEALRTSGMKNFNPSVFRREVDAYNTQSPDALGIPLGNLDWNGVGKMKLVAKIAIRAKEQAENEEEPQERQPEVYERVFQDDASSIGKLLGRAGAPDQLIEVLEPDHLTLCRFRRSRSGEHQLTDSQKFDIANIVQERLSAAEITAVTLGGIALDRSLEAQPLIPVLA